MTDLGGVLVGYVPVHDHRAVKTYEVSPDILQWLMDAWRLFTHRRFHFSSGSTMLAMGKIGSQRVVVLYDRPHVFARVITIICPIDEEGKTVYRLSSRTSSMGDDP